MFSFFFLLCTSNILPRCDFPCYFFVKFKLEGVLLRWFLGFFASLFGVRCCWFKMNE